MRSTSPLMTVIVTAFMLLEANSALARTQTVYNVIDKPIHTLSGDRLGLSMVEEILRNAATTKRWVVSRKGDGHLQAEIHVRKHFAAIDITFDETTYSIKYRDSKVLRYDGEEIHRNYNKWTKLIEKLADTSFEAR